MALILLYPEIITDFKNLNSIIYLHPIASISYNFMMLFILYIMKQYLSNLCQCYTVRERLIYLYIFTPISHFHFMSNVIIN